jgi:YVTN family beta-propeller protein
MSELVPKISSFSVEENPASTITNRFHWEWILFLEGELQRIRAWMGVQQKKKDGQYLTQEGKYLRVGSDEICSKDCCFALNYTLIFLTAEANAARGWLVRIMKRIYITDKDDNVIATNPAALKITGRKMYGIIGRDTLSVADISNLTVDVPILKGRRIDRVSILPNGKAVYAIDLKGHCVFVVSTENHEIVRIPVEGVPNGKLAFTPDSKKVYVLGTGDGEENLDQNWRENLNQDLMEDEDLQNWRENLNQDLMRDLQNLMENPHQILRENPHWQENLHIFVIATTNHTVIKKITIPILDLHSMNIAVIPDGKKVYIAVSAVTNNVFVIDTSSDTVISTINIEKDTNNFPRLAVTPDGAKVYVIERGSRIISVIDTSNDTAKAPILMERPVYNVTSKNGTIYAIHEIETDGHRGLGVSVIDTSNDTVTIHPNPAKYFDKIDTKRICTLCWMDECINKLRKNIEIFP